MQQEDPIRAHLESIARGYTSQELIRSCVTGFGQRYVLYGLKNADYGKLYELYMMTANGRNIEVISQPLKLSTYTMKLNQLIALMAIVEKHFSSNPPPDLATQPPACIIPVNAEILSFSLIDLKNGADQLLPGDEVYVASYLDDGRIWNHSGIHLGGGWFCHFVPTHGFNLDDLNSGRTVPGVVKCDTTRGFIEAVPSTTRKTFRITHPILVREGLVIVENAKQIMDSGAYNKYNYLNQNCQHFSSLCSYGREFSYDSEKLFGIKTDRAQTKVAAVAPVRNLTVKDKQYSEMGDKDERLKPEVPQQFESRMPEPSHYAGGPMAQFKIENRPSNLVSEYCASFEMTDSEYFSL